MSFYQLGRLLYLFQVIAFTQLVILSCGHFGIFLVGPLLKTGISGVMDMVFILFIHSLLDNLLWNNNQKDVIKMTKRITLVNIMNISH